MVSPTERKSLRDELAKMGFKGDYIDSWQPRVDCWSHKPRLSISGKESTPAGFAVPNQPGEPYHAVKLSRRGVLPWRPSPSCRCKACRERDWDKLVANSEGLLLTVAQKEVDDSSCPKCDYVVPEGRNTVLALRAHGWKHLGKTKKRKSKVAVAV